MGPEQVHHSFIRCEERVCVVHALPKGGVCGTDRSINAFRIVIVKWILSFQMISHKVWLGYTKRLGEAIGFDLGAFLTLWRGCATLCGTGSRPGCRRQSQEEGDNGVGGTQALDRGRPVAAKGRSSVFLYRRAKEDHQR